MARTSAKLREALRDDVRAVEIRLRALAQKRPDGCGAVGEGSVVMGSVHHDMTELRG